MENTFIPYNLFLKLKEKGLDNEDIHHDDIFGYYLKRRSNGDIIPRSVAFCEYNQNIQQWDSLGYCIAPTYNQIIDWFENKNIIITVAEDKMNLTAGIWMWNITYGNYPDDKKINSVRDLIVQPVDTRYQAYIQAFEEALKLI